MSNAIQSLQSAKVEAQTQQKVQPPKKAQTTAQNQLSRDTVAISKASQQARAGNTNAVATGDKDRDSGQA